MSEATRRYSWMLEKIATGIRDDWTRAPYIHDLRKVLEDLNDVEPDLLAGALWRFCSESNALSPLEFKARGAWWLGKYPRITVALPGRFRPPTDEERAAQLEANAPHIAKTKADLAAALSRTPVTQEGENG